MVPACLVLVALPIVSAYEIDGNSVLVDDTNVYIRVTPAYLGSSGWITLEVRSKTYTGDVDIAFGFDSDAGIPKKAELYDPRFVNVTRSKTCQDPSWYNYTVSPKVVQCWETVDSVDHLLWIHSFDYADTQEDTIYYYEDVFVEWRDISGAFDSVNHEFDGKDKWFFKRNVPIVAGQTYEIRTWIDVPICFKEREGCEVNGKYDFAIKPSSETIGQAISAGHFYFIDPWWNVTWEKRQEISIQNDNSTTAIPAGQVVEVDV